MSRDYGSGDSYTLCGPRSYSLILSDMDFISMPTTDSVELRPTMNDQVGTYNCTMTVELSNYPGITTQVPMTCEVTPCVILSYDISQ